MPKNFPTDPVLLAAQARPVLEKLHLEENIVVRFKTDESGFAEDALDDDDREMPGHFRSDKNLLTLNLDKLIREGKDGPRSLATIEDFRLHPVLAGAAAHESGHARWSNWDELPDFIPNPDYDAFDVKTHTRMAPITRKLEDPRYSPMVSPAEDEMNDEEWFLAKGPGFAEVEVPSEFKVSGNGKLLELAGYLEEPRIERLGATTFSKTWRRAMQFSAGHLILEDVEEMNADGADPIDAAVRLAVIVGGRMTAGTLGASLESRNAVKTVLLNSQKIIEQHVASLPEEYQTVDPYHKIMGLINKEVFNDAHDDAIPHLEGARTILKIVHPDQQDDPDKNDEDREGEGAPDPMGAGAGGAMDPAVAEAMAAAMGDMQDSLDKMEMSIREEIESEEDQPEDRKNDTSGGHGATRYKNPRAPQVREHVQPNAEDQALYKRALAWMERQIEPSITEGEESTWLPGGGSHLNVRQFIRDNLAGHRGMQRSDWTKPSEVVKLAPPVKVAIMLDGSGSMARMARPSAAIAWAASNAAADLPESRTVSVVYGNAAQVTQIPGHVPARDIAVSNTDGSMEDFYGAAKLVEEHLWLDEEYVDDNGEDLPSNTLIVIVSDLGYGGSWTDGGKSGSQWDAFVEKTTEWADRGYQIMVVGAHETRVTQFNSAWHVSGRELDPANPPFKIVTPEDLFKLDS